MNTPETGDTVLILCDRDGVRLAEPDAVRGWVIAESGSATGVVVEITETGDASREDVEDTYQRVCHLIVPSGHVTVPWGLIAGRGAGSGRILIPS